MSTHTAWSITVARFKIVKAVCQHNWSPRMPINRVIEFSFYLNTKNRIKLLTEEMKKRVKVKLINSKQVDHIRYGSLGIAPLFFLRSQSLRVGKISIIYLHVFIYIIECIWKSWVLWDVFGFTVWIEKGTVVR